MAISTLKGARTDIRLWTPVHEVESSALDQLKNIAALPWIAHLAVMPDVHFGKGATVGSVIALRGAVSPAAVGVDIGCGMGAVQTHLVAADLPDNLDEALGLVEQAIPLGASQHEQGFAFKKPFIPLALRNESEKLLEEFGALTPEVAGELGRASHQLGTLGGGNHFIELCLDGEDHVWLMLHSGSRWIGNGLAKVHMAVAKQLEHNQALKDRDLAVFLSGTPQMQAYRRDLFWAQRYAMVNRKLMMQLYLDCLVRAGLPKEKLAPVSEVWCHHNYIAEEVHFGEELLVTRKGAIRAGKGDLGIIPGSMGAHSFIVKGLGNEESLCSASHGAGRAMSRGQAKRTFTVEDLVEQTRGITCRKTRAVLDEIPGAYKDISTVMAYQADLVEVVAELHQVMCVKAGD